MNTDYKQSMFVNGGATERGIRLCCWRKGPSRPCQREEKRTRVEHQLRVEQRDDEHLGLLVLLLQTLANLVDEEEAATSIEDSGAVVNIDSLLFPL